MKSNAIKKALFSLFTLINTTALTQSFPIFGSNDVPSTDSDNTLLTNSTLPVTRLTTTLSDTGLKNLRGTSIPSSNITCTFNVDKSVKALCKDYFYYCHALQCSVISNNELNVINMALRIQHATASSKDDNSCGDVCKNNIMSCLKKPEVFTKTLASLMNRWKQPGSPFINDDTAVIATSPSWRNVEVILASVGLTDQGSDALMRLLQTKISACETTKYQAIATARLVLTIIGALFGLCVLGSCAYAASRCSTKNRGDQETLLAPDQEDYGTNEKQSAQKQSCCNKAGTLFKNFTGDFVEALSTSVVGVCAIGCAVLSSD